MEGKVIIFSAPSGSGKSTIIKHLLTKFPQFEFSISATSRSPRNNEVNGRDYYFLSIDEFCKENNNGSISYCFQTHTAPSPQENHSSVPYGQGLAMQPTLTSENCGK